MSKLLNAGQLMQTTEVIEPGGIKKKYWRTLWEHRELGYFMVWRDLIVRYKQTLLGVAWVWLKPFVSMVIFALLFGSLAKLDSQGLPYGLVVLVGMLAWNLFAHIVNEGGNCLVGNAGMITKIYFPRLLLPIASTAVGTIDFLVSCILVVFMFAWYQIVPSWHVIFLPIFLIMLVLPALGIALICASLNVKYRDFRILVPFSLQIGLYASPVAYITTVIPEKYEFLYFLNPMASVIEGFRWCFFGETFPLNWLALSYALIFSIIIMIIGIFLFRTTESHFADVI